jgi:hypothetical protein
MDEKSNIEELLNGYADGELTQRQHTEVQRLLQHDENVAKRLREIQRCKILVGALPSVKPPADLAQSIMEAVESKTLRQQPAVRYNEKIGARDLLFRKLISVAAVVVLVGVLAGVIFTILSPQDTLDNKVAEKQGDTAAVNTNIEVKPQILPVVASADFAGRLELTTSNSVAVQAYIKRVIEENNLASKASLSFMPDNAGYTIRCGENGFASFVAGLENIWTRFDSATLYVETDQPGREVAVDMVSVQQIKEIVGRDTLESRIKTAQDYAVLNTISGNFPGKEIFASLDNKRPDFVIPKPLLAGPRPATKTLSIEQGQKITLTIVVSGTSTNP